MTATTQAPPTYDELLDELRRRLAEVVETYPPHLHHGVFVRHQRLTAYDFLLEAVGGVDNLGVADVDFIHDLAGGSPQWVAHVARLIHIGRAVGR